MANDECRKHFGNSNDPTIYNGTLCTFGRWNHAATCKGDTGGPLISNGSLIGVASWGMCGGNGELDGFTRVSEFLNWIQEVSGVGTE